jgi:hypothetical protein
MSSTHDGIAKEPPKRKGAGKRARGDGQSPTSYGSQWQEKSRKLKTLKRAPAKKAG